MKFLVTRELGRLATWLRILGFDALYLRKDNSGSVIIEALRDARVVLTRNTRLPQSRGVKIVRVRSEQVKAQVAEVLKTLGIAPEKKKLFSRCVICNEELAAVEREKIKERVPEYVFKTQKNFFACPQCRRVYWQGTHWGNVEAVVKQL